MEDYAEQEEMATEAEIAQEAEMAANISARFVAERAGLIDYYEGAF
jgi:hypothetical protein